MRACSFQSGLGKPGGASSAALLAMLGALACSTGGGADADASGDSGETGETGEPGPLVCDEDWTELERKPFYVLGSYGGDGFYVGVAFEQVVSFDGETWSSATFDDMIYADRVWASAPDDVWIIDVYPANQRLLHWDGAALTTVAETEEGVSYFSDLWGTGPGDVWVAGRQNCPDTFGPVCDPLLRRYDGETFVDVVGHGLQEPSAIWGRGPDDVFVGSRAGMTAHFDGLTWSQHPTGDQAIRHIAGDETMVYAVAHPSAFRWYGAGWSVLGADPVPYDFGDVAVVDGRLWGASYSDWELASWETTQWVLHDTQPTGVNSITAFAGELWVAVSDPVFYGSATFMAVAMAADAQANLELRGRIDYVDGVLALGGDRLDGVLAVADTGTGYAIVEWAEDGWRWRDAEPPERSIWDMQVRDGGREIWTVGSSPEPGSELRLETPAGEHSWKLPEGGTGLFFDVWANGIGDVWVVGSDAAHHFDGASWLRVPFPGDDVGLEIVTAGAHIYLRTPTSVYELFNGAWKALRHAGALRKLDAAGPGALWMIEADELGRDSVVRFDGAEWTTFDLGQYTLSRLEVKAPDDVYVLADRSGPGGDPLQRLLHWDGETWTRIPTPYAPAAQMVIAEDGILLERYPYTYTTRCERE